MRGWPGSRSLVQVVAVLAWLLAAAATNVPSRDHTASTSACHQISRPDQDIPRQWLDVARSGVNSADLSRRPTVHPHILGARPEIPPTVEPHSILDRSMIALRRNADRRSTERDRRSRAFQPLRLGGADTDTDADTDPQVQI